MWFVTLVTLAIAGTSLANYLRSISPGPGLVAVLLLVLVSAGTWLAGSLLLPHGEAPWTALIPGAILVGGGMQILHLVTVFYFSPHLATSSAVPWKRGRSPAGARSRRPRTSIGTRRLSVSACGSRPAGAWWWKTRLTGSLRPGPRG